MSTSVHSLGLKMAPISTALNFHPDWSKLGNQIAAVFRSASSGRLRLTASSIDAALGGLKTVVGPGDLNKALDAITDNPGGLVDELGLLFAERWNPNPSVLGVMFDTDKEADELSDVNGIPREGCAVFVDAIRSFCVNQSLGNPDRYIQRTAIHELGHCFNLQHDSSDDSFMSITSPTLAPTAFSEFLSTDAAFLCCADDLDVIPGVVDFGYGSVFDGPPGVGTKSRKKLKLVASVPRTELLPGEPLILDVKLCTSQGSRATYRVPNELDTGFDRMRVFVEQPYGARLRVRSRHQFCGFGGTYHIGPGKPLRNNVNLFSQGGRPIFDQPGHYSIHCEFFLELPSGRQEVIASDPVEVDVMPWDRCKRLGMDAAARFLRQPAVAQFLEFRGELNRPRVHRAMQRFVDDHRSKRSALYIAFSQYVLARAERARLRRGRRKSQECKEQIARHIEAALASDGLSIGSHSTARNILREIESGEI